jgi:glycosyltransferase involved in cell wall biosynthesis
MKVAYLTAQYPKTSHSFIRREIAALERQGFEVLRHSVRPVSEKLVDPDDIAELGRTRMILGPRALPVVASTLLTAFSRPRRWIDSLLCALQMGWRSERGLFRHLAYFCEACDLVRALERQHAEHLHAHFATNATSVALLTHRLGGPAYSFTVHGPDTAEYPRLIALERKIKEARFVVTVSHNARAQLMRYSEPRDWCKIFVVHCGLDAAFLRQPHVPLPREPRIVCVARLDVEKGHLVLLEAVARLAREGLDFELELIGDGPLRSEIERAIRTWQLERRVKLSGWLGSAEVRHRLLASRVLVLPSFSEGLPVVLMEALALGRPVIASCLSGTPELVVNGENGWLVPSSSLEDLVYALREALTASDVELERIGARGRERVLAGHDVDAEAQVLSRLFRHGPGTPAPGGRGLSSGAARGS